VSSTAFVFAPPDEGPARGHYDAPGELLISRSAVSEITDQLWVDYQQFIARDLSEITVEYLFSRRGV
jgi:hypothetical protein